MSLWNIFLTIFGMSAVTLFFRAILLLPKEELPLPRWLRDGLQYAPLAALAAVVAPEILMNQGVLLTTWENSRLAGALGGLLFFAWKRSLFGTICVGTMTMLGLRLFVGWP